MLGRRVLKGEGMLNAGSGMDDLHIEVEGGQFQAPTPTFANVQCCECGTFIQPNPTRMCIQCLQTKEDVTAGISRQVVLPHCSECDRYMGPPWLRCEWESQSLMALCLKKVRGLNKVQVVNSQFVWTEPHSKRIKIKVTVRKGLESSNNAMLEQSFTIEFHIHNNQCEDCKLTYTPHSWNSMVQVRQRTTHKRTMLVLEQLIIKNDAHEKVINIVERKDGLDFQFTGPSPMNRFYDFVNSYFPTKHKASKTLVSHNEKNGTAHQKFTIFMEIAPVNRDDVVFIPPKVCIQFGGICPLMFVHKVTSFIHLIDPFTLKAYNIPGMVYWQHPFESVLTRRHLCEFFVIDVELIDSSLESISKRAPKEPGVTHQATSMNGKRKKNLKKFDDDFAFDEQIQAKMAEKMKNLKGLNIDFGESLTDRQPSMCSHVTKNTRNAAGQYIIPKFKLGRVTVARKLANGKLGDQVEIVSHLGSIVKPGDTVAGYDLRALNLSGKDDEELDMGRVPYDVILVKKVFKGRSKRAATRNWTLQRLNKEEGDRMDAKFRLEQQEELEVLKAELEEDPEMRRDYNLYYAGAKNKATSNAAKVAGISDEAMEEEESAARNALDKIAKAKLKKEMKSDGTVGGFGADFGNDAIDGIDSEGEDEVPLVELCEMLDGLKVAGEGNEEEDEEEEEQTEEQM